MMTFKIAYPFCFLAIALVGCDITPAGKFRSEARKFIAEAKATFKLIEISPDLETLKRKETQLNEMYAHLPEPNWKFGKSAKDCCKLVCGNLRHARDFVVLGDVNKVKECLLSIPKCIDDAEFYINR